MDKAKYLGLPEYRTGNRSISTGALIVAARGWLAVLAVATAAALVVGLIFG